MYAERTPGVNQKKKGCLRTPSLLLAELVSIHKLCRFLEACDLELVLAVISIGLKSDLEFDLIGDDG